MHTHTDERIRFAALRNIPSVPTASQEMEEDWMIGVKKVLEYVDCFPEAAWCVWNNGVVIGEDGLCDEMGNIHNSMQFIEVWAELYLN